MEWIVPLVLVVALGPVGFIIAIIAANRLKRIDQRLAHLESWVDRLVSGIDDVSARLPSRTAGDEPAGAAKAEEQYPVPRPQDEPDDIPQGVDLASVRMTAYEPPVRETEPKRPQADSFSLERFIGLKAILWIGSATFIFGVAYTLKVAYEKGWLGAWGVDLVVYAVGAIFVGVGHYLRRRGFGYAAEGLAGLGFSVFYAAGYCAVNVFEILSPEAGFAVMVATTVSGAILAACYRSQILAGISFLGGYMTPILVSTYENRGAFLVFYLALLGCGVGFFNFIHRWRFLKFLSAAATFIVFHGWYTEFGGVSSSVALAGTSVFVLLFTLLPTVPIFAGRFRESSDDAILIFAASSMGFLFYLDILEWNASLASASFGLSAYFLLLHLMIRWRDEEADTLAISGLVLAVTFFTIAVPAWFENWMTAVAWALEGSALLLLGIRFRNQWLLLGSIAGHALALVMTIFNHPIHGGIFTPILNRPFCAWMAVIAAFVSASVLWGRSRYGHEKDFPTRELNQTMCLICASVAGLMLFAIVAVESSLHFKFNRPELWRDALPYVWLAGALINTAYSMTLKLFDFKEAAIPESARTAPALLIHAAVLLFFVSTFNHHDRNAFTPLFNYHFISGAVLVSSFGLCGYRLGREDLRMQARLLWGGFLIALFFLLSVEVYQYFRYLPELGKEASRWALASLSVLWSVIGAAVLCTGILRRNRPLRYTALVVFSLTIVKVFLLDTSFLEPIYRILGFLTLGGMLIALSFGYSRFLRRQEN